MDEQLDIQLPPCISVITVLPNDEREIFSINPEITVADFKTMLQNTGSVSDSDQNEFSIIHSGKILQSEEKFSEYQYMNQITVYILFQKISNTNPQFENTSSNNFMNNNVGLHNEIRNDDNMQLQNLGHVAIFPRFFNYHFFPFVFRRRMNDEDPILGEHNNDHEPEVNPRFIVILDLIVIAIYFMIGFFLGLKAIFLLIFILLFSSPKFSIIGSLLEGILVRFSWEIISHYLKKR